MLCRMQGLLTRFRALQNFVSLLNFCDDLRQSMQKCFINLYFEMNSAFFDNLLADLRRKTCSRADVSDQELI